MRGNSIKILKCVYLILISRILIRFLFFGGGVTGVLRVGGCRKVLYSVVVLKSDTQEIRSKQCGLVAVEI
jgi:hypothetical protein